MSNPNLVQAATIPAFPGAEGFGRNATGGRGGTIYKVTNTNDSGSGSLRECAEASGARICVFEVGGTINLTTDIVMTNDDITINGRTAPGGGIAIEGANLLIHNSNVILRYIRFRIGDSSPDPNNADNVRINGQSNVIVDHSSFSWSTDENFNIVSGTNITVQWSIFSEGLYNSTHDEQPHSMGFLTSLQNANISIHHNLFAHNQLRNPVLGDSEPLEFINNIVYDYSDGLTMNSFQAGEVINIDAIGNYYIQGQESLSDPDFTVASAVDEVTLYVSGNLTPGRTSLSDPEENAVASGSRTYLVDDRHVTNSTVNTTSVTDAYTDVLAFAGANYPSRDSVDTRIVQEIKDLTGEYIDAPSDVGGYPTLAAGTAPTDTDNDGMPDSWENTYGLDPNTANDSEDADNDGYTNIEEYLNGSVPKQLSSWTQNNWLDFGFQTLWENISNFSSSSSIDNSTEDQISLNIVEKLTNTDFNFDADGWDTEAVVTAKDPTDVSGLLRWYKADAISGVSDGSALETWVDSSGNSQNASQSTESIRPIYNTDVINGQPAVRWDGVDDYMSFPAASNLESYDIFFVGRSDADGESLNSYLGHSGAVTILRQLPNQTGFDFRGNDFSYYAFNFGSPAVDTNWHIMNFNYEDTTFFRRADGEKSTARSASDTTFTFSTIGSRQNTELWDDYIAEVIIFGNKLSESDRLAVENYLSNKYNLDVAGGSQSSKNTSQALETSANAASNRLISPSTIPGTLKQTVNVGDTKIYNLTAAVYTDGTAVTNSDAQLYYNGSAVDTTYSSLGSGWYRLSGTVTGANENRDYGVQAAAGQTIYVDDVSVNRYQDSGTLTSSIFDSGRADVRWGTLEYTATTPLDSSVEVRVRTSDNSDMSGAPSFGSCDAISSGTDVSGNNCVDDGDQYAQYQVTLYPSSNPHTPTFDSFTLHFGGPVIATPEPTPPGPEICNLTSPSGTPDLFQISTTLDSATVYFTPVQSNNDGYYVSYSENDSAEEHGVNATLGNEGVQSFTVNKLKPNTTYYFKVRGQNGCATGDWSAIKSARTLGYSTTTARQKGAPSGDGDKMIIEEIASGSDKDAEALEEAPQTYDVLISVHDEGQPIGGVNVEIHSDPKYGVTDDNGEVILEGVEPGEHTVKLAYNGLEAEEKIFVDGDKKEFNVSIEVEFIQKTPLWMYALVGIMGVVILSLVFLLVKKNRSKKS